MALDIIVIIIYMNHNSFVCKLISEIKKELIPFYFEIATARFARCINSNVLNSFVSFALQIRIRMLITNNQQ